MGKNFSGFEKPVAAEIEILGVDGKAELFCRGIDNFQTFTDDFGSRPVPRYDGDVVSILMFCPLIL